MRSITCFYFFYCVALWVVLTGCREEDNRGWRAYRGDGSSNAYSALQQINRQNAASLQPVWTYRAGGASENTTLECNPIVIDNILYGVSPALKTFALDAATGNEIWVFDPNVGVGTRGDYSRGLTFWEDGEEQRIFTSVGSRLIALNAKTGEQINSFGHDGYVDLNEGLQREDGTKSVDDVKNTSPGVIYGDLIIIGSMVGEDYDSSPGHIRAYDVRTGEQRWIFHTVPEPGEFGYDTWPREGNHSSGGCNAWAGLSIDKQRGIVFVSTGSPTFDFHGGERFGENLFGNCVIALDAVDGSMIWHYQTLHHDLWDYDLPAPANLVTVEVDGQSVDAVAQVTKQGYIFLFQRQTGKPIFPIEVTKVPISVMPGEQSWPTQPIPVKPPPLGRQKFDESVITDISPEAHDFVLNETKKYAWGNIYQPPAPGGVMQMPGMRGGAEWSGACVDNETGILYVGINEIASVVELVEKAGNNPDEFSGKPLFDVGAILYEGNCSVCHGADRKGNASFPSLMNMDSRLSPVDVKSILEKPGGRMPSFAALSDVDKDAIIAYLYNKKDLGAYPMVSGKKRENSSRKRYSLKAYNFLKDQNGYPGTKPPWGTLNAVDLNKGEILWTIPLGEYPELMAKGIPRTGTQLFGGGIVTAGGLIFIGASADGKFRAIDKSNGKILWEYQLPCGGYATPSTYEVQGKQYVVIAAGGGGGQATPSGDYYIAFALPQTGK